MQNKQTVHFKYVRPSAFICSGLLLLTAACSKTTNRYGMMGSSETDNKLSDVIFDIDSKSVARMVAKIRANQRGPENTQNALVKEIAHWFDKHPDDHYKSFERKLLNYLKEWCATSQLIYNVISKIKLEDTGLVGYPIRYHKTHLQLEMAKGWVEEAQAEPGSLMTQILDHRFYHNLSNDVSLDELPVLRSPSDKNFWGNENDSVTSILLVSIIHVCNKLDPKDQIKMPPLAGATTFYDFEDPKYELGLDLGNYPFARNGPKGGMWLFGAYQYGGHRNFPKQLIFGPEDCSSAVGKAIYLKDAQIVNFSTTKIHAAYSDPENPYNYAAVCTLSADNTKDLNKISPGHIYLKNAHTAIVASKPNNKGVVASFQYNREIDTREHKTLGGGRFDIDLINEAKEAPIFILNSTVVEPLRETCTLSQFLRIVDSKVISLWPKEPHEISGDPSRNADYKEDCLKFFED